MITFGIYNIVVSIILIVLSINFIKYANDDIKEDEAYKEKNNVEWIDKFIKAHKRFKIVCYFILFISFLVILGTLFIFIIKFMEVL